MVGSLFNVYSIYIYPQEHALQYLFFNRVLVKIYSMKVFKYVCPFAKDLHSEINTVAKVPESIYLDLYP